MSLPAMTQLRAAGPFSADEWAAAEDAPTRYAIEPYQTSTKFNPESMLYNGTLILLYNSNRVRYQGVFTIICYFR